VEGEERKWKERKGSGRRGRRGKEIGEFLRQLLKSKAYVLPFHDVICIFKLFFSPKLP
jgi:hypothetical protein